MLSSSFFAKKVINFYETVLEVIHFFYYEIKSTILQCINFESLRLTNFEI